MCGIAGFAQTSEDCRTLRPLLAAMCDAIRHRGPDDHMSYRNNYENQIWALLVFVLWHHRFHSPHT